MPSVFGLRCGILNVGLTGRESMLCPCEFAPEISGMIQARHELAIDGRHVEFGCGASPYDCGEYPALA